MFKKARSFVFAFLVIAITACNSPSSTGSIATAAVPGPVMPMGEPETRDLASTTETVWNCGGGVTLVKHPVMSVVTNHTFEWQVGGTSGVGVKVGQGVIPGGVDLSASLESHFSISSGQDVTQGTGWDLPAEANSIVVYTLMWREKWQRGYVDVRLVDQNIARVNVQYRVSIQSDIVGIQRQNCPEPSSSVTTQPSSQPASTQVVVPSISTSVPRAPADIPQPTTSAIDPWACIQQADTNQQSTWETCWKYVRVDPSGNMIEAAKEKATAIEWIGPTDLGYTTIGQYHDKYVSEWYAWAAERKEVRFCIDIVGKAGVESSVENIAAGCYAWSRGPFMISKP
jgi:hypothetical protein